MNRIGIFPNSKRTNNFLFYTLLQIKRTNEGPNPDRHKLCTLILSRTTDKARQCVELGGGTFQLINKTKPGTLI